MEPGELWAYRKRAVDPLEPVTYLRHRRGDQPKHKYSLVRFEAEDADGREEWVPDGRLKCPWSEAKHFEAEERKWIPLIKASDIDWGTNAAITLVLEAALPDEIWGDVQPPTHLPDHAERWLALRDLQQLADFTGLTLADLCSDPLSFQQGDSWVVPANTAYAIAEKLAPREPEVILKHVEDAERELKAKKKHWEQLSPGTEPWPATRNSWDSTETTCRLLREWIGRENNDLRKQALDADQEIDRLRGLVEWGIGKLAGFGHKASAETLRRNLGAES
ncbi:hypothetical protein DM793_19680 [Paenarthrobacter nitroguajacolicus]|uniref:hypothetical protein n=1 Tax=Paenarthrobacter nitroguajacolicus TaxID=211146 RepID=UPI0015BD5E44|nr:hypothetical protein [Paenarthrobacter nitroguajacolicus]NWL13488.1 hypothetical protein [Paenarthrobacter nitroguajacolicus]